MDRHALARWRSEAAPTVLTDTYHSLYSGTMSPKSSADWGEDKKLGFIVVTLLQKVQVFIEERSHKSPILL